MPLPGNLLACACDTVVLVLTTSSSDLNVQGSDSKLLASSSNILSCQHSSVWGGLVAIGLDFHASSNSANGFAATMESPISL